MEQTSLGRLRNSVAAGALALGIVLLSSQIIQFAIRGISEGEMDFYLPTILFIYLAVHLIGGFAGGYLLARRRKRDYLLTGTVVAMIAYVFEFLYNLIVEGVFTDAYALFSLIIGAIIGAYFFRARIAR